MDIHTMNEKVSNLIRKIEAEEGAINNYVKQQIALALDVYSQEIKEPRFYNKFQKECSILEQKLTRAKYILHNLPAQKSDLEMDTISDQQLNYMLQNLFDLERQIKNNKIEINKYANTLHIATTQAQHIDLLKPLSNKQRMEMSLMFLTLYTNTPPVKITQQLTSKVIPYLLQVSCVIGNFNIQKLNLSEAEMVEGQLTKVLSILEHTKISCTEALEKLKQKLYFKDPNHTLNALNNELNIYYNDVTTLGVPISEEILKLFKQKIFDNMNARLSQVPDDTDDFLDKKSILRKKAQFIIDHLEKINEKSFLLTEIEQKIAQIIESSLEFEEKKSPLENLKKDAEEIDTINEAILTRKNDLVRKIPVLVMAEAANYFRQKLEILKDYRNYAQEFPFPKHITMYDTKRNEINELKSCLYCLNEDNEVYKQRVQVVTNRIQEVSTILEKKADENKDTLAKLETLQTILQEIGSASSEDPLAVTLEVFNNYRNKIEGVSSFSSRITKKKLEVLKSLHNFEKMFFEDCLPALSEVISRLLDKYEDYTRTLTRTNVIENFLQKREELTRWQTDTRNFLQANASSKILEKIFGDIFSQLWRILHVNEELNECIRDLEDIEKEVSIVKSENSDDKKRHSLVILRRRLASLKTQTKESQLSNRISTLETKIVTEESKMLLIGILDCDIQELEKDINTRDNQDYDMGKIENVLILKERIQDVSDELTELEELKKTALKRLYSILHSFDGQLAKFVFKKRQFEKVIKVDNYFKNLTVDDIPNKESIKFVEKVFAEAKTFEESVKCYLGTKDSIDYYIIYESLMKLLEELHELKCDDAALLDEATKAMAYIKQLKTLLISNATHSE